MKEIRVNSVRVWNRIGDLGVLVKRKQVKGQHRERNLEIVVPSLLTSLLTAENAEEWT